MIYEFHDDKHGTAEEKEMKRKQRSIIKSILGLYAELIWG